MFSGVSFEILPQMKEHFPRIYWEFGPVPSYQERRAWKQVTLQ